MRTFLVGSNTLRGCETLIAHRESPVLRMAVEGGQILVDLRMPEGSEPFVIERNRVTTGNADVKVADGMTSVVFGDTLVVHAVLLPDDAILVHLDLRPLRAAIHTYASGLHVGDNLLSANVVHGARIGIGIT